MDSRRRRRHNQPIMHMTRIAAALLVLAGVVGPVVAQRPQQTDRDRDELTGPVKALAVAAARPGDPSRVEPVERSTYTRGGSLAERVFYVDGAVVARVVYRDDPSGARYAVSTTPEGMGYGIRGTRLQPREQPAAPFVAAADGTYTFAIVRAFDTAGRLIDETIYAGADPKTSSPLARIVARYDAEGRMSERSRLIGQPGAPVDKETYRYDAGGRLVEAVHYRQGNTMPTRRTFAYEFDAHGNWTKRVETETLDGIPVVTTTTRTITYD